VVHEHQSPSAGIPWDKEAVYRAYAGPLNNWSNEQIDVNVFKLYSHDNVRSTAFDRNSIGGRSAFKMAIREHEGRWWMYTSTFWEPGYNIIDITDPTRPTRCATSCSIFGRHSRRFKCKLRATS
jgi:hypothetical protein